MRLEEIYRPVRSELEAVHEHLLKASRAENKTVRKAVSPIVEAGGKRLRPALLLMAAKACDYVGQRATRLAVAIELIHTASLIHDDVIDSAEFRRGNPAITSRWGNKVSIVVGDYLYSKVFKLLTEDGDLEVMRSVATTVTEMTESEMAQTLRRNDVSVTKEDYLSIIAGKTASLMVCSCRIGAMLGGGRDGEVALLGDYGLNLGMAFQITDDLLDLTGEKEKLGKPVGNDIREGRLTLPFIHATRVAKKKDREWMMEAFRSGRIDESALTRMRDLVRGYGGIDYSLRKIREYGRACKERLESLASSECRASLAMLADYVVERAR
ncbi:MAG: polyprenyl synthetase family protein [Planctomycetota bacterium]|jgi:octaprenyl-diphosphate synthase